MADDLSGITGWPTAGAQIFMCPLRDRLVSQAQAGDREALKLLVKALPAELPDDIRLGERDRQIRELAKMIRELRPGATAHRISTIIAAIGKKVETGGPPIDRHELGGLAEIDEAEIATRIRKILAEAPLTRDGRRWPRLRTIIGIISES